MHHVVHRNHAVSRDMRRNLERNLEKFRIGIWTQDGLNQRGGFFGLELILSDKTFKTLVQRARSIHDLESLTHILERESIHLRFAVVGPHAQKLIDVIVSTLAEQPTAEDSEDHANPNLRLSTGATQAARASGTEIRSPTLLH